MIVDGEARMAAGDRRRCRAGRAACARPSAAASTLLVRIRRHDHHRVDPAAHRAQHRRRLIGIAVGVGEQQVQAARPGRQVDAADQLGEEFAVKIGEDARRSCRCAGWRASGRRCAAHNRARRRRRGRARAVGAGTVSLLLKTRETVATETSAARATSRIVAFLTRSRSAADQRECPCAAIIPPPRAPSYVNGYIAVPKPAASDSQGQNVTGFYPRAAAFRPRSSPGPPRRAERRGRRRRTGGRPRAARRASPFPARPALSSGASWTISGSLVAALSR